MLEEIKPSSKLNDLLEGCRYIVEATDFETHCIWEKMEEEKYPLRFENQGWMINMGNFNGHAITVQTRIGLYREERILFWEATSEVVSYKVINEGFSLYDIPKCDARNFHNCKHSIDHLVNENSVNFIKED